MPLGHVLREGQRHKPASQETYRRIKPHSSRSGVHRRRSNHDAARAPERGAFPQLSRPSSHGCLNMAQPRRVSRPDRSAVDHHRRVNRGRHSSPPRAEGASPRYDGDWIDPRRLIESAFRDRGRADDPETYVLAWLALLRAPADAPWAAATLSGRLMRLRIGTQSAWQRRILELLAFVARHRSAARAPHIVQSQKKGMS
jgi:hypothetical protein